jgi:catechol 2,3-dioxygenase-like lactoylglutathione lyase family enzyme
MVVGEVEVGVSGPDGPGEKGAESVDVLFIAGVAVVAADPVRSRKLYTDALGLPLEAEAGSEYFHSERIGGAKHFGIWPLAQAALACFGNYEWPSDRPLPQLSIDFEVADFGAVAAAAAELSEGGFELLHGAREEEWGEEPWSYAVMVGSELRPCYRGVRTVARLLSPEGSIVGISYTPSLRGGS